MEGSPRLLHEKVKLVIGRSNGGVLPGPRTTVAVTFAQTDGLFLVDAFDLCRRGTPRLPGFPKYVELFEARGVPEMIVYSNVHAGSFDPLDSMAYRPYGRHHETAPVGDVDPWRVHHRGRAAVSLHRHDMREAARVALPGRELRRRGGDQWRAGRGAEDRT